MSAIRIDKLRVAFGDQPVLDGITLNVERGEIVAVLGPSGCGKSTLLRAIAGLDAHPLGTIAVEGDVGYVFQEPRLFPWLSVEKNVRFAARTPQERARVDEVLELTGLQNARETLPKALSGGMAQRTALARALVRKPSVLLLDEPLAALDALRRMQLQEALAEIIAAVGATAILVTHDIEEALYLADRIVVLRGTPATIALQIAIPPHKCRNRDCNLTAERSTLFHALSGDELRQEESA
ncbi:MAG TPA: ABC transporter ATP-binding protein [Candidatus Acidoferrales bacterium]|nr:ABC transporter ATP-binding protein [Candidatus Acidoferrales bacterium]